MKRITICGILTLFLLMSILTGCGDETPDYDTFAKCLEASGLVMYGSVLCPHCMNVKEAFGDSFQFITYVECNPKMPAADPERCIEEEVQYLPTFKFGDGTKSFGEQEFSVLAQRTGCPLP